MVPAGLETRQLMPTQAKKPVSRRFYSVISAPWRISNYMVFAEARVTTKWRHWLHRKARTQHAKTVRCKRKENDYEHCCISCERLLSAELSHDKEILTTICGSKFGHRNMMDKSDGRGLSEPKFGTQIWYS
jgi:hypothetical protein